MSQKVAKYAKAIVAVLGAVLVAVLNQFPGSELVQNWGPIVAALLTAVSVYVVPNGAGESGEGEEYAEAGE